MKGWICIGVAAILAFSALRLFVHGLGYFDAILDDSFYADFLGHIERISTIGELRKYAYINTGLSIFLALFAVILYRKFLKMVPVIQ
ncbi:hypothetical protein [Robertmurraya kyonggiensis]|uniref:Uncharacterized protein n=1 Tax=Robertmurraya kyonggiensis TaxID=1037680 RepID=A0A4U1D930_9BACI|nr:hypothetical protein [Robertmurraya kyonggiensis]TKC18934.1 hypothetical protein FA727_05135 [Robertmurraya kyonggiensis]